jgi:DNA-binding LytR/AlgR family response regulator
MERLPAPVRGPLISLSVTDHYVHVTTARGTHMLLMRLSDAIAETEPTEGLQIHRSHWVAQDAIQSVQRGTRKSEVILISGSRLPVSRTYLPQLKEAGFLPRSGA